MHRPTRRSVLAAGGLALSAAIPGCEFRQEPPDTTAEGGVTGNGDDGVSPNGAPADGDGGGSDQETVAPDASYDILVQNTMDPAHLRAADLAEDEPAAAAVSAVRAPPDGERETVFERQVELAPDERTSMSDAFSTQPGETEYIVRARLESFRSFLPERMSGTAAFRFTPGGYGSPTTDRFVVELRSISPADAEFVPLLSLELAEES